MRNAGSSVRSMNSPYTNVEKAWLNKVADVQAEVKRVLDVYQRFGSVNTMMLNVMINRLREKQAKLEAHRPYPFSPETGVKTPL